MLKKYTTIVIVFCFSVSNAQKQSVDTIKRKRISNEHIELYDDYIKLRFGFSNSFNSFHIKDQANNLDFILSPNQRMRSTLTFTYKFIEFDLGYTPQFIRFNKDDEAKGKTRFFNLGTRLYFGNWVQDIQYAKTKGYYIDKDNIGTSENLLFPEFQVTKIGGSTSFLFNPDFSFRAILLQSEWQKKSAGSFMPGISYYLTTIKDGKPGKDNIIDIAAGPAYYYNWVIYEKFLVSGGLHGGIGYNSTKTVYNDGQPDEMTGGLSLQSQFRFTVAYNSEHFYTGAAANLNSFYYDYSTKLHVQDQQKFFEFYIGYRFKGPDKIKTFLGNPPRLKPR